MTEKPRVTSVQIPGAEKPLNIPSWMMKAVENRPGGGKRRPMQVGWFYRFLETGNAEQSAVDVGYSPKCVSNMAWRLKIEFGNVLPEAVKFMRSWLEPDALRLLAHVVTQGLDEKNKKDSKILLASVRAAGEILDRGGMPKGMAMRGLDPTPAARRAEKGWRELIDQMVETMGIEAVRMMKSCIERWDYRDYINRKWPLKEIEGPSISEPASGLPN